MVSAGKYVPERGDVIWITVTPRVGHEQAGRRPAVVLSPAAYNRKVGLALVCPITSRVKGYPFEVTIPGGLPIAGVVLCDQIKSLDWDRRHAERIRALPSATVAEILQTLGVLVV